ncbi:WD40 repeat protein [Saccharopolyspora erythraea NRRL 2338]|nr:PD40 domain-containing protein [Saccharopolyspora erythraea]EQD82501.1 amidohydrolase [Saccharopolyspora erythraea D]PFG96970.1 WD40 repeat protein [Saccharopolyspora erythraea NRRL 2338]
MDLSRRALFRRGGQAAAGVGAMWFLDGAGGAPVALARPGAPGSREVVVTQATNASAAVAPGAGSVVVDLLNVLWSIPIGGGAAVRLTDVLQEAAEPDFSPDGSRIVFQSYQDGNFHLCLADRDGRGLTRLTSGPTDQREPRFSPDGTRVAFAAETDGRYGIHVLTLATGEIAAWTSGSAQEAQPVWTPDGSAIAFTSSDDDTPQAIDLVDAHGNRRTLVTVSEGDIAGPTFSPDGRLGYVHRTPSGTALVLDGKVVSDEGEDVFPFSARWLSADELLYTADGRIRRRALGGARSDIPFTAEVSVREVSPPPTRRDFDSTADRAVKGIVGPVLSPDGTRVAFQALGDIWVVRDGEEPEAVVSDGGYNTGPAWSPDGRTLVYAGDRAGTLDLWLHDLETGQDRRLTDLEGDETGAVFSPDGSAVAFLSGRSVHTVDVASGAVRKVVGPLNAPGRPSFSADGTRVCLAGFVPTTARFREGENLVLTVELATGEMHYTHAVPGRSLSNRIDSGPVYSPDGTSMAFVVGGVLWVSGVDDRGRPSGEARRLGDETAASPSWSEDSRTLLYLSNGKLRRVSVGESTAKPVRMRLTWRPAAPSDRKVIRAGALWDGTGPNLRRDVDIVVRGNRIAEVVPSRGALGPDGVDARDLTVMPGMIATHEHMPWENNSIPKLWLAFGVTSVRSPGSGHYLAVEAKEAQASGKRVGPRLFTAGEIIDGSRVYYDSNRPVTTPEELARELERVSELEHDLVKTYVRLPYSLQQAAIEGAHRLGVPVTSHYLFGPVNLGADAVEHHGGTSRYLRRQKETHLGHAYDDVVEPLVRSGMTFTPTLGLSGLGSVSIRPALYHHAGWALDDPRLRALLPPQMYEQFREEVQEAVADRPEAALAFTTRQVRTVRRILDGGGHVALGTDSPLVPHGVYYHLNAQYLVRDGITTYEALRSATVEGGAGAGRERAPGHGRGRQAGGPGLRAGGSARRHRQRRQRPPGHARRCAAHRREPAVERARVHRARRGGLLHGSGAHLRRRGPAAPRTAAVLVAPRGIRPRAVLLLSSRLRTLFAWWNLRRPLAPGSFLSHQPSG